jgi:hypothetical protein
MVDMASRIHCEICGVLIPPHAHYVVRTDVFFNADMPQITQEELDEMDFDGDFQKLIEQMKKLTPEEAQDQVHRRFEHKICAKCQRRFLANPLGLPRVKGETTN